MAVITIIVIIMHITIIIIVTILIADLFGAYYMMGTYLSTLNLLKESIVYNKMTY